MEVIFNYSRAVKHTKHEAQTTDSVVYQAFISKTLYYPDLGRGLEPIMTGMYQLSSMGLNT